MTGRNDGGRADTGADGLLDDTDSRVLADIAELWEATDPVPKDLALEIRFQLTVRALHAEVAELQRDAGPGTSLTGTGVELVDSATFRDDDAVRTDTLTFSCDPLSTMVTVTALTGDRVRIDGWVTVPGCRIELRVLVEDRQGSASVHHLEADGDGRYTVDEVVTGLAQLVFHHPDRTVVTPYFDL